MKTNRILGLLAGLGVLGLVVGVLLWELCWRDSGPARFSEYVGEELLE